MSIEINPRQGLLQSAERVFASTQSTEAVWNLRAAPRLSLYTAARRQQMEVISFAIIGSTGSGVV